MSRTPWRGKNVALMARARGWDGVPYTMAMKASLKETCRKVDSEYPEMGEIHKDHQNPTSVASRSYDEGFRSLPNQLVLVSLY